VLAAVLAAAAYVAGMAGDVASLRLAAKPVPVLVFALLVLSRRRDGYARAIAGGLVLSAAGDVLLERPGGFVPGLVAFLLAHLAYTGAFVFAERRLRAARAIPFAAWLVAAFVWLRPGFGPLAIPVAAYMLAIGAMMWRAAARTAGLPGDPVPAGARAALAGAVLFGLSDTLLAIDRFRAPLPLAGYAVIGLYWAGQAALARSAVPPPAAPGA
jgi:alkenylglycerophosphocholine hydrolase